MVASAVAAVGAGSLLLVAAAFAHVGAHAAGPNRAAATALAEQTLRVAENAFKYGGASAFVPAQPIATTIPSVTPSAAPTSIPVSIAATVTPAANASAWIVISVAYPPDPGRNDPGSVTIAGRLLQKAVLPGSQVAAPSLVAQPSGAP